MNDDPHHIRLVAGFEIRPTADARFVFERQASQRLGGCVGEDLAHCVAEVTRGHLVTGPALLEPGQILSPDHAPWEAMRNIAGPGPNAGPGTTAIGATAGRLAHATLMPYWSPPQGLFLALPMLLAVDPDNAGELRSRLEQNLFETGGLRPPALAALSELGGVEPVHGQLMTRADLMALVKVQLAGAGLDPFWPPVEHALLDPGNSTRLELPAGLTADYNADARGWELAFAPLDRFETGREFTLWLRALRQTAALLESHLVRWRAVGDDVELDPRSRWARRDLGAGGSRATGWRVQHPEVGLVGYSTVTGGRVEAWYPLDAGVVGELETMLRERGVERFEDTTELDMLGSGAARRSNSAQ